MSTFSILPHFVGGADLTRQLKNPLLRSGYQNLFNRVSFVTYPDKFGLTQLKAFGVPRNKLISIPAALPLKSYEIAHRCREKIVIMAGRPIARKNHIMAIEIAKLSKTIQKMIVIGKGNCDACNDSRIIKTGIISHKELIKLLTESCILLQTGNWEGDEVDSLPTVVLEALAMGVPVVSTPLVGIIELSNKFPEFIKIADNSSELAQILDKMLTDYDRSDINKLRHWIFQKHSLKHVAYRILNLYKEIL